MSFTPPPLLTAPTPTAVNNRPMARIVIARDVPIRGRVVDRGVEVVIDAEEAAELVRRGAAEWAGKRTGGRPKPSRFGGPRR